MIRYTEEVLTIASTSFVLLSAKSSLKQSIPGDFDEMVLVD
ncbi:hypothetical protein [Nocardia veterana]|nr:hypothetical protein [Nocardia veterana]